MSFVRNFLLSHGQAGGDGLVIFAACLKGEASEATGGLDLVGNYDLLWTINRKRKRFDRINYGGSVLIWVGKHLVCIYNVVLFE